MFAVVILGIGFVMVAAVFPVAVEQTRATSDEATASALARDVTHTIVSYIKASDFSDASQNGITQAFSPNGALLQQISGNLISATNPRFACVPFYCTSNDGTLRLTLLIVRRWLRDSYTQADLASERDLSPRGIAIDSIVPQASGSSTIQLHKDPLGFYQSAAPGGFVIINNFGDNSSGRAFQIAAKQSESTDAVVWTLSTANGLQPGESYNSANGPITGYIIGRDFTNPSADAGPGNPYFGPAQDVSVYTTFITPR